MKRIKFTAQENTLKFSFPGGIARLRWNEEESALTIALLYRGAYGMGEKFDFFNQKEHTVVNCVEEKFCHQGSKTYCTAPFFMTDTGFGLYVETDYETVFVFGEEIRVSMPQDSAVILFEGNPKSIISEYMSVFGPAKLPPKWAFGPWISANHWDSQEKTELQVELLRKFRFPATVLVLEAWSDEATFYIFNGARYTPCKGNEALRYSHFDFSESQWPSPESMIEKLHSSGLHLVLWQIPVYKKQGVSEAVNAQNEADRAFAAEEKLCVQTDRGTPYQIPEGHWFSGSMIPDFTNPETKRLWFEKRQYLLDIGVDGFKTDGGEFIYNNQLSFQDGSDGAKMKNRYSQSYLEAYTEFIGEDRVLFSRAGYSGQHTTPIHWAGDQQSENSELKSALRAGLSAAMTGIPFWGFDIAGFAGPLPTLDLYRRATQLACFCPVMQWHSEPDGGQFRELMAATEGNNERSPWNLATVYQKPEFIDEMRFWHNLRMNLLPYLFSTAIDCVQNSRPMLRPLIYDFFSDERVRNIDSQFLLGDGILVAPLLEENTQSRSVYLPQGDWYDLFTGERQEGGQEIDTDCGLHLPVYLRSGCGIALNLDASKKLGSDVGSNVKSYRNLHFILAGPAGSYRFRDDLGNDFTLRWEGEEWKKSGLSIHSFSVQIMQ